jgi:hypothetical protein
MDTLLVACAICYFAIAALAGLVGKNILEEKGIGTPGDRELMGYLFMMLWPLYGALYVAWSLLAYLGSLFRPGPGAPRFAKRIALAALLLAALGAVVVWKKTFGTVHKARS